MKGILLFFISILLVSCQAENPTSLENKNEDITHSKEEKYDEEKKEEDDNIYNEEDLRAAREESYRAGYIAGNDEGYALGYSDALSAAENQQVSVPGSPNLSTPTYSSGLSLFSDGMNWDIATNYDKKEFVRAVLEANGQFVTFSELDDYVMSIDIYYESNTKLNTLKDALESLR